MFTLPFNFILIPSLFLLFIQNPIRNLQQNYIEIKHPKTNEELNCELMDTNFKRGKGLMFIPEKNSRCLTFDFKKDTNSKFYNVNVAYDVQIYFLDKNMKVVDENILKSNSFKMVGSSKPYRYVVEIPIVSKFKS